MEFKRKKMRIPLFRWWKCTSEPGIHVTRFQFRFSRLLRCSSKMMFKYMIWIACRFMRYFSRSKILKLSFLLTSAVLGTLLLSDMGQKPFNHLPVPCHIPEIAEEITAPGQIRKVLAEHEQLKHPGFSSNKLKIILLWTKYFFAEYSNDFYFFPRNFSTFQRYGCRFQECDITSDRSMLPYADAVLFHARDLNISDMPKRSKTDQIWIIYSMEPPKYVLLKWNYIRTVFNWTMTYRSDSDIQVKYGEFVRRPNRTLCENEFQSVKTNMGISKKVITESQIRDKKYKMQVEQSKATTATAGSKSRWMMDNTMKLYGVIGRQADSKLRVANAFQSKMAMNEMGTETANKKKINLSTKEVAPTAWDDVTTDQMKSVMMVNSFQASTEEFRSKINAAAWLVSNCRTQSRREAYVRELRKHFRVDVFGKCSRRKCEPPQSPACYEHSRRYKFYLSFENSICKDYVTEKFFNLLAYDVVPVVLGGADYSAIAPPGSYIDATRFPDPTSLAEFLTSVSGSETLYRGFLRWKREYSVHLHPWMCDLCKKLYESVGRKAVPDDLRDWWVSRARCYQWTKQKGFRKLF